MKAARGDKGICTGKWVYTEEGLAARPYVQWVRGGGQGPPPGLAAAPAKPERPAPARPAAPPPAEDGICAMCALHKPLPLSACGMRVCGSCAMLGVDAERLGSLLAGERRHYSSTRGGPL